MSNLPIGLALGLSMNKSNGATVLSENDLMLIIHAFAIIFSILSIITHFLLKKLDYYEWLDFVDLSFKAISGILIIFLFFYYLAKLILFLFGN